MSSPPDSDFNAQTLPGESSFEFISLFTNYTCNFKCSYCSEQFVTDGRRRMPGEKPLAASCLLEVNRFLKFFPNLVLYIHGGEPLLYRELEVLLQGLEYHTTTVVTNLSLPLSRRFSDIRKLKGKTKFIGSYHSGEVDPAIFMENARILNSENMIERICAVEGYISETELAMLSAQGFETVLYPFSGIKDGRIHPKDMREHAGGWITGRPAQTVLCRSAKFLVDPYGRIWNCSTHMYTNDISYSLGTIRDNFSDDFFRPAFYQCDRYGYCNPCQGPLVHYRAVGDPVAFRVFPAKIERP
jgi:hypothetical protein